MAIRQATNAEIRVSLGHGEGNCKVRILKDGAVSCYGSTDAVDRSQDYWHDGRWVDEYFTDPETNVTWIW